MTFLEKGYRLPFENEYPEPSSLPNNRSATDPAVREFVEEELAEHLKFGWISEIPGRRSHHFASFCCEALRWAVTSRGGRLAPDQSISENRKNEVGWHNGAVSWVKEGCYMASLDLHKAYYQMKVHAKSFLLPSS